MFEDWEVFYSIKDHLGNTRVVFSVLTLIGTALLYNSMRKNSLENNFRTTEGSVIDIRSGGPSTGGITFSFSVDEKKYRTKMTGYSPLCGKSILKDFESIKKEKFPVVYETKDFENAEILLFKKQYERFEIPMPEEIAPLINKISNCEN